MSEDPFLEKTEDEKGSFVELTIKGGQYQSHVITVRKPTREEVESELAACIPTVVGAQASLERAIKEQKASAQPAPAGNYGKPTGADTPSSATDLPFADSGTNTSSESKVPTCKHGARTLVEYKGQSGWICSKPKGDPDRCATVPA